MAARPVYLEFRLQSTDGFEDDEEYVVPEGTRLRIEFVGVLMSGTSIGSGELHTSVALRIRFTNDVGGTCNRPKDDGECSLTIPVIPLNNTDVGANVPFGAPSTAGPVLLEVPPGGRVSSRLALGGFGAPDPNPLRIIDVQVAGQLIDMS
jgi:hypothetical protein